jgi:hypothetical protein
MPDHLVTGAMIIAAYVALKFLDLLVAHLFKRNVETEYVTTVACGQCESRKKSELQDFKKEMREGMGMIKGMLVAIAAGKQITTEDIQNLIGHK